MRNEDIKNKIIRPYEKDYYQAVDTIRLRIQKKLNNYRFQNDRRKDRKGLGSILRNVLQKYADLGVFYKWGFYLDRNIRKVWCGTITIHKNDYSTYSQH